jgi:hypothetical protein
MLQRAYERLQYKYQAVGGGVVSVPLPQPGKAIPVPSVSTTTGGAGSTSSGPTATSDGTSPKKLRPMATIPKIEDADDNASTQLERKSKKIIEDADDDLANRKSKKVQGDDKDD